MAMQQQTKNRLILLGILIVIAVAMWAASALLTRSKNTDTGVADSFVTSVASNKPSNAYKLTSNSFQLATSSSDFKDLVSKVSKVYTDKPKRASAVDLSQDSNLPFSREVDYTVGGKDGTYKLVVELLQENGKWRVGYFNSSRQ